MKNHRRIGIVTVVVELTKILSGVLRRAAEHDAREKFNQFLSGIEALWYVVIDSRFLIQLNGYGQELVRRGNVEKTHAWPESCSDLRKREGRRESHNRPCRCVQPIEKEQ